MHRWWIAHYNQSSAEALAILEWGKCAKICMISIQMGIGHGANHACVNVYSIEFAKTEDAMNYWPGEINLTSQRAYTLFAFRYAQHTDFLNLLPFWFVFNCRRSIWKCWAKSKEKSPNNATPNQLCGRIYQTRRAQVNSSRDSEYGFILAWEISNFQHHKFIWKIKIEIKTFTKTNIGHFASFEFMHSFYWVIFQWWTNW